MRSPQRVRAHKSFEDYDKSIRQAKAQRRLCLYIEIVLKSVRVQPAEGKDNMFFTRDRDFYKTLVKLAIPIALQNAVTFAVNFADNLMIGSLGDSAISGVYVGNQLQTLLQMFIGGIEGAILILAAQYWGKRDTVSIRKIVSIGVRFSVAIGALITLVAFLCPAQIMAIFTDDASVIEMGTPYVRIISLSYLFFCISQVMVASMRAVETAKIGLYV